MVYYQYPIYKESSDGLIRVRFDSESICEVIRTRFGAKCTSGDMLNTTPHYVESAWFDCPSDVNKSYLYEVIEGTNLQQALYTDYHIVNFERELGRRFVKTGRRFVI